jgi:BirA family biotin operon repressor/biotin-[acetyl-CoA-carboxylase] ligase
LIAQGAGEGIVVTADTQTKGRGKPGRSWFSAPKIGLYLSIILKPRLNPNDLATITLLGAKAVVNLIKDTTDLEATIKPPNDVLLNGKKICGILTERLSSGEVIIGLGLNANNPAGSFPDDISQTATSLLIETGQTFALDQLQNALLKQLDSEYLAYLKGIC